MPNSAEHHVEQLRACAALGGNVEITEVGCDEAVTRPAAAMLAGPAVVGGAYNQLMAARTRLIGAAALPNSSPESIARHAETLVSLSAGMVARTLVLVESNGGQVRYRGAA